MEYNLFTLNGCEKCEKVKEYLQEKGVKYKEINAGFGEGMKEFREFYKENREKIQRESDGTTTLPILAFDKKIIQGLEKITKELK